MSDQTTTETTRKHSLPVAAVLATADLLISLMLMTRRNERTVHPTRRVTIPDHVKRGLAQIQEYKCMFCGVRRKLPSFQIDHVNPVVRGGSNQTSNLQLLCSSCNQRKGIQTNEEFYTRYQRTLRGVRPGVPPKAPIPQAKFKDETKKTRAHNEVRKFKKTRYINPAAKIKSGSPRCRRRMWSRLVPRLEPELHGAEQPCGRHLGVRGNRLGLVCHRGTHRESKDYWKVRAKLDSTPKEKRN